jgi:hypothetical protein
MKESSPDLPQGMVGYAIMDTMHRTPTSPRYNVQHESTAAHLRLLQAIASSPF